MPSIIATSLALATLPITASLRLEQLPKTFEPVAFSRYASSQPGVVAARFKEFLTTTGPLQIQTARLFAAGRLRRDDVAYARATREALASLGPTFVKLGQILSVREDVLGPVWAKELALLQNELEPVPTEAAMRAIAEAFDGLAKFEHIDSVPVATASIAQVHRGVWREENGTTRSVAIKLIRPGVVEAVATDLCVLLQASDLLATWAPRVLPASRVDWRALLLGLAGALWEEVDLEGEADRQRRFQHNLRTIPRAHVPEVYASTPSVMVSDDQGSITHCHPHGMLHVS